ncbi:MAG TPA: hypothetical protein VK116_10840, partial [Planctomycetota bacterium]|nr:hypothetical protein [Planctomycetota bacterium]
SSSTDADESATAAETETNEADPPHLREVRELFRHLAIAEKNIGLYPPYSRVVRESIQKLAKVASACLETTGPLRIQVTQKAFLWERATVYVEEARGRNLAFRVYKDGVREIIFLPDVAAAELESLAICFNLARDADEEDDDFTTLFWERDTTHIQLQLADDYLSQDDLPELPDLRHWNAFNLQRFKISKEEREDLEQALGTRQDEDEGDSAFVLTEAETESLRDLVRQESTYFPLFDFVDILLELMARNRDQNAFEESVRMLRTIIASVIEDLDFERAGWLMKRLVHEAHPGLTPDRLQAIRDMIATFNDKQTLALLENFLCECDRLGANHPVFQFMKAFPPSAIESFCAFLRFEQ